MPDENLNLALDLSSSEDGVPIARVFLQMACSYTRGQGAPTLTRDCRSYSELEQEVHRLVSECEALLEESKPAFGAAPKQEKPASAAPETTRPSEPLHLDPDLKVSQLMTQRVETMHRNDKVSVADELMKVGRFRHVVVVDDDDREVVGVVSHRDIFYGAVAWSTGLGSNARQKALEAIAIKDVMRTDVVTVSPDTTLAAAAEILLTRKIGCLPVVEQDRLVGILTEGDFLSLLTRTAAGE